MLYIYEGVVCSLDPMSLLPQFLRSGGSFHQQFHHMFPPVGLLGEGWGVFDQNVSLIGGDLFSFLRRSLGEYFSICLFIFSFRSLECC